MGKQVKPRKSTFKVHKVKGVRKFAPINKRAKRYARALGVRKLSADDLRTIRANGSLPCAWVGEKLQPIKL